MSTKIHYAGEVWDDRGLVLAGWAACCSGDRAIKIRDEGRNTRDKKEVTCLRCLERVNHMEAFHAKREAEQG
jgi:hypothetical protein